MDLNNAQAVPTVPVTDFDRARDFYGNKLGLREAGSIRPDGETREVVYKVGNTHFCLYERPEPSGSKATTCSFEVQDVEATVKTLRDKGIRFEEYDIPAMGLKTKNGVATTGELKSAWFKDPDGNIIGISNGMQHLVQAGQGQPLTQTH